MTRNKFIRTRHLNKTLEENETALKSIKYLNIKKI